MEHQHFFIAVEDMLAVNAHSAKLILQQETFAAHAVFVQGLEAKELPYEESIQPIPSTDVISLNPTCFLGLIFRRIFGDDGT